MLDGGEEQCLIHQLIGGAGVVAGCDSETRHLIELCDGEVIRQGEYAEQQQGGGEDDADAGGARGFRRSRNGLRPEGRFDGAGGCNGAGIGVK